jgi:hypothetical protein
VCVEAGLGGVLIARLIAIFWRKLDKGSQLYIYFPFLGASIASRGVGCVLRVCAATCRSNGLQRAFAACIDPNCVPQLFRIHRQFVH